MTTPPTLDVPSLTEGARVLDTLDMAFLAAIALGQEPSDAAVRTAEAAWDGHILAIQALADAQLRAGGAAATRADGANELGPGAPL